MQIPMQATSASIRRAKFDRAFTVQDDVPSCSRKAGQNGSIRKSARFATRSRSQRRGTLSSIASLSFSQKQALTASWRLLRPQAPGLFRKVFLELEIVSSKVKQIFYKALCVDAFNKDEENIATMDVHIRLMVKFFDDLLATLDDEAECTNRMKRIGTSHAVLARTCGFTSDIWERLGEITMERICAHELVQLSECACDFVCNCDCGGVTAD
ncbi:hypothetical protein Y032_0066g3772 [Ancylostoma ceylanicum]|uniref:Globin domain-containing protein n=1 Tax=Ancylostoma ceylanicum TaxID=53326 RepID=A0A016U040_9BILA|nr:hypothetical protein Y032_0066g3772 [Ancylostoma ceylanicum]